MEKELDPPESDLPTRWGAGSAELEPRIPTACGLQERFPAATIVRQQPGAVIRQGASGHEPAGAP